MILVGELHLQLPSAVQVVSGMVELWNSRQKTVECVVDHSKDICSKYLHIVVWLVQLGDPQIFDLSDDLIKKVK